MAPRALITLTAAIVFAALAIGDVLAVGYAVAGFAVITLSVFLALRGGASEEARRLPLAIVAEHATTRWRRLSLACPIRSSRSIATDGFLP